MESLMIPITKAKVSIEVPLSMFNESVEDGGFANEVLLKIYEEGLKVLLNAGNTKFPTKGLEGEELKKAMDQALAKAESNFADLKAGKVKAGRSKAATGHTGEEKTEAMAIAKKHVKAGLKADGIRISHVETKEITRLAGVVLEANPWIWDQAKEAIKARNAKTAEVKMSLGVVTISEAKVKAAEAKKAQRKATTEMLSATQAVKAKARPSATAH